MGKANLLLDWVSPFLADPERASDPSPTRFGIAIHLRGSPARGDVDGV
jgi:hypothetical protein